MPLIPHPANDPVVVTTGTGELEALAAKRPGAWKSIEIFVWPGQDQYLGVKSHAHKLTLADGTVINLCEWRFMKATPAQLRALADAVEARQGDGWKDRLDPATRARIEDMERSGA